MDDIVMYLPNGNWIDADGNEHSSTPEEDQAWMDMPDLWDCID